MFHRFRSLRLLVLCLICCGTFGFTTACKDQITVTPDGANGFSADDFGATAATVTVSSGQVDAAAGGTVSVTSGQSAALEGSSVTVPAGALGGTTTITIGSTSGTVGGGSVGPAVAFGPSGTTFTPPATVSVPYNPASLGGTPESSIRVLHTTGTGSTNVVVPGGTSSSPNTVNFSASSFSRFEAFIFLPTESVSRNDSGTSGDAHSTANGISGDGRYIVFTSISTNLYATDLNDAADVFRFDRQTGTLELVSVTPAAGVGNGNSDGAGISDNGRFVAFLSSATDLVANGPASGVYVRDMQTGITRLVSVDSAGNAAMGSFATASISGNGRFIAFVGNATNLVPGVTDSFDRVYLHDLLTGQTELVSKSTAGVATASSVSPKPPALSFDGNRIAFESPGGDLVGGDTNGAADIFVRDRAARTTVRVSLTDTGSEIAGASNHAAISRDGRFVAFDSAVFGVTSTDSNSGRDVYVRDLAQNTTTLVSVDSGGSPAGVEDSSHASFAGNGRYIAFKSDADLANAPFDGNMKTDIYVRDRDTDFNGVMDDPANTHTRRVSLSETGGESFDAGVPGRPFISANGLYVAYASGAADLVATDQNGADDVFVSPNDDGPAQ